MGREDGDGWVFEATDLATGRVKAVLRPISAEWEDALCQPTTATINVAVQDPSADDVFATETGIFISRLLDPSDDNSREVHWGGYIEDTDGQGGNPEMPISAVSMDTYLNHRLLADDDGGLRMRIIQVGAGIANPPGISVWKPVDAVAANNVKIYEVGGTNTTLVAHTLVTLAQPRGIPLIPSVTPPFDNLWPDTDGAGWEWWEFKNIGAAIREMVEATPSLKYWITHSYFDGYWSSVIHFSDEIGVVRDYTLRSDYEAWKYALRVDGKDKASRVYGIGGGSEETTQFSVAYDAAERAPEFQATVAWKDQTEPSIIDKMTSGYVTDHRDPIAVPAMTLIGLPSEDEPGVGYPPPALLQPGDKFDVDIGYGAITVKDIQVKCLGVTSKLEQGKPLQRVIAMLPVIRPSDSIRTQTPARSLTETTPPDQQQGAQTVDPWPKAGLVTKIHPNILHEISGTQVSYATPGEIWVHNDNEAGDLGVIYRVSLATGEITARFKVAGGFDFESIRMRPGTKLHIGDLGDNDEVRSSGKIFRLDEPVGGGDKGTLTAETIVVKYPFGAGLAGWVNTESLLLAPDGQVITITKENNRARVVTFGVNPTGTVVGTLVATLNDIDFVVDATYTFDGRFALLRTNHNSATFVYETTTWKRVGKIKTPDMPKSEGITVESTCSFLVTTEAQPHAPIGQTETPVYRVLIPTQFGALCGTPSGPSGGGGTLPPANTGTTPAEIINLNDWKLTLPIGKPTEIFQPQLANYTDPRFFYAANGAVMFECPSSGSTTANSANPRTELRQMKNGGKDEMAFSNANRQYEMSCVLRFAQLPTDCDVVGMQIHDGVDDVTVLRRIGSELWVTKGDTVTYKKIATGVTDASIFNMRLVAVKGGGFQWFLDGNLVADRGGTKSGLYFKAGCYVQRGDNPSGSGKVAIYALSIARTA